MPLASSLTPESRFMSLFVGSKHSGKTVAACSWIREGKIARVDDLDGRIKGILGAPWIDKDRVDYTYYEPRLTTQNAKPFFSRFNDSLESFLTTVQSGRNPYSLYIGDSITALADNLIMDAVPQTHQDGRGKKIGILNVPDPGDYNFQTVNINNYLGFLRSMPVDIIVTAHIVPKWDKPRDEFGRKLNYADSVIVGEKLSLTDKIGANIPRYFDHIFRFDRDIINGEEHFFVEYISEIACTSFPGLKPGRFDITGKNFKEFTLQLTKASLTTDKESKEVLATK